MKEGMLKTNSSTNSESFFSFNTKWRKWLYVFRFCLHPFLSSNKQCFMQIILPWKKQTLGLHFLHMDFIWINLEFEHSTSVGSCSVITAAGQVTCGTCRQGLQNSVSQVSNFPLCPLVSWLYRLKVLRSLRTFPEPGISSSGWLMGSFKIWWLNLFLTRRKVKCFTG